MIFTSRLKSATSTAAQPLLSRPYQIRKGWENRLFFRQIQPARKANKGAQGEGTGVWGGRGWGASIEDVILWETE